MAEAVQRKPSDPLPAPNPAYRRVALLLIAPTEPAVEPRAVPPRCFIQNNE